MMTVEIPPSYSFTLNTTLNERLMHVIYKCSRSHQNFLVRHVATRALSEVVSIGQLSAALFEGVYIVGDCIEIGGDLIKLPGKIITKIERHFVSYPQYLDAHEPPAKGLTHLAHDTKMLFKYTLGGICSGTVGLAHPVSNLKAQIHFKLTPASNYVGAFHPI
jgi:hypothetical protein